MGILLFRGKVWEQMAAESGFMPKVLWLMEPPWVLRNLSTIRFREINPAPLWEVTAWGMSSFLGKAKLMAGIPTTSCIRREPLTELLIYHWSRTN